ncbi:PREDICTED: dual specificity protein phosphatase 15 isoform X1 [Gavialis gangeticus]|uniref:dual specificity protein phosphatase 15 isoform X1 n=2 Tax=Gavialis gangeticus TaxID=94835 RepID=UPI00092F82CA|nr:PREDICTED: dual specificity protein phosphatase 15 isoform X1 [Gavialis gangeticus]
MASLSLRPLSSAIPQILFPEAQALPEDAAPLPLAEDISEMTLDRSQVQPLSLLLCIETDSLVIEKPSRLPLFNTKGSVAWSMFLNGRQQDRVGLPSGSTDFRWRRTVRSAPPTSQSACAEHNSCTAEHPFADAKDLEQLNRNKITHIISIHESPQPLLQEITYLRIPLPDAPEANIKKHFKECISFIHHCRLRGGNCLVHCLAGISRSTTIVIAYVMAVTGLSWQEVLDAVKAVRPVANPNPGFKQQLEEFGRGAVRKVHRHLEQRFGADPFSDEAEIKALLPAGRGGASGAEGARQGLVPRSRSIKGTTAPFLLRVKRTFSCIPTCLK